MGSIVYHQSAVEVPYILIREFPSTVTDGFRSVRLRAVGLIAMFDLRLNFPLNNSYILKCDVLVCNHEGLVLVGSGWFWLVLAATKSLFFKEQENAKDI